MGLSSSPVDGPERFGRDKIVARLAGRPLIDHVLAAVPADWEVVVVDGHDPLHGRSGGCSRILPTVARWPASRRAWTRSVPRSSSSSRVTCPGRSVAPAATWWIISARPGRTWPRSSLATRPATRTHSLAAYRREDLEAHLPRPAHGRRAKLLLDLPHLALDVVGNAGRDVDRPEDLPCEE